VVVITDRSSVFSHRSASVAHGGAGAARFVCPQVQCWCGELHPLSLLVIRIRFETDSWIHGGSIVCEVNRLAGSDLLLQMDVLPSSSDLLGACRGGVAEETRRAAVLLLP
jgi:hypothetical protein